MYLVKGLSACHWDHRRTDTRRGNWSRSARPDALGHSKSWLGSRAQNSRTAYIRRWTCLNSPSR